MLNVQRRGGNIGLIKIWPRVLQRLRHENKADRQRVEQYRRHREIAQAGGDGRVDVRQLAIHHADRIAIFHACLRHGLHHGETLGVIRRLSLGHGARRDRRHQPQGRHREAQAASHGC